LNTHPVLRISGCTLYSLAKTNGTIPCGRAACCILAIRCQIGQTNKHVKCGSNCLLYKYDLQTLKIYKSSILILRYISYMNLNLTIYYEPIKKIIKG